MRHRSRCCRSSWLPAVAAPAHQAPVIRLALPPAKSQWHEQQTGSRRFSTAHVGPSRRQTGHLVSTFYSTRHCEQDQRATAWAPRLVKLQPLITRFGCPGRFLTAKGIWRFVVTNKSKYSEELGTVGCVKVYNKKESLSGSGYRGGFSFPRHVHGVLLRAVQNTQLSSASPTDLINIETCSINLVAKNSCEWHFALCEEEFAGRVPSHICFLQYVKPVQALGRAQQPCGLHRHSRR